MFIHIYICVFSFYAAHSHPRRIASDKTSNCIAHMRFSIHIYIYVYIFVYFLFMQYTFIRDPSHPIKRATSAREIKYFVHQKFDRDVTDRFGEKSHWMEVCVCVCVCVCV